MKDSSAAAERCVPPAPELQAGRAVIESLIAPEHQGGERAAEAERTSPVARRDEMIVAAEVHRFGEIRARDGELHVRLAIREAEPADAERTVPAPDLLLHRNA